MSMHEPGTTTLVPLTEDELWTGGEPVRITKDNPIRVGDVVQASKLAVREIVAIRRDRVAYWSESAGLFNDMTVASTNGFVIISRLDENGVSQPVTRSRRRKTWRELYGAGARYWQAPGQDLPKPIAGLCYEDVSPTGKYTFYRIVHH